MYSWYLDQRHYHYSLKKQIMTMWFPTLHFYPWDNTTKAKSNVLCIQTSKSLSEMRNREKIDFVCLYTEARKSCLFLPSQKKTEKLHSLDTRISDWNLTVYPLYLFILTFVFFILLSLCAFFGMFYSDLPPVY